MNAFLDRTDDAVQSSADQPSILPATMNPTQPIKEDTTETEGRSVATDTNSAVDGAALIIYPVGKRGRGIYIAFAHLHKKGNCGEEEKEERRERRGGAQPLMLLSFVKNTNMIIKTIIGTCYLLLTTSFLGFFIVGIQYRRYLSPLDTRWRERRYLSPF